MAVKEIPVNMRTYYKSMIAAYTQLKTDAVAAAKDVKGSTDKLWQDIYDNKTKYANEFGVDLLSYDEFASNKYIDGTFIKLAKGMFINRKNDYVIVAELFDLVNLAKKQKQLYDLEKDIAFYDKLLSLSLKQYTEILRVFYTEVHKHMILNGEGYVFEDNIGWTCINRCHIERQKPMLDFDATRKKKEELLAQGKRLYNKEEAEWCKANGIEYNGEQFRVFKKDEYCYEIPLLGCKLPNGSKYKLETADYRNREVRGMHNNELIAYANNDTKQICNLPLDLRTKLNLCNTVDKMLYLNFIRNENQKPSNATQTNRKNRQ